MRAGSSIRKQPYRSTTQIAWAFQRLQMHHADSMGVKRTDVE